MKNLTNYYKLWSNYSYMIKHDQNYLILIQIRTTKCFHGKHASKEQNSTALSTHDIPLLF